MAIHTKRDGETLRMFLNRISAWNNGEPVYPEPPQAPYKKHDFPWFSDGAYCDRGGCYAKRGHRSALVSCPNRQG